MNTLNNDEDNLINDNSKKLDGNLTGLRSYLTFDRMNNSRTNHVNDNFTFQNMPAIDSIPSFHNHRMQSIKSASHHISNTVERYSNVSAQLKSTFNQISSRQSISSNNSSSSESTNLSFPSSIVEIIVKSTEESLFKSAENLLRSKESSMNSDDEVLIKSTNQTLISTHENLFRCLSITDESIELNNSMSSSSSLDSSSFENIYSLYPLNKRPNSINKSKTTQELSFEDKEEASYQNKITKRGRRRSLSDKNFFKESSKSLSEQKHYLVK